MNSRLQKRFARRIMAGVGCDHHPLDELQNPKNKFATEVISADMQLLGRYYRNENRVSVEYTDISPHMINALIATEDVRYYDHTGVDIKSLMRAVIMLGVLPNRPCRGAGRFFH